MRVDITFRMATKLAWSRGLPLPIEPHTAALKKQWNTWILNSAREVKTMPRLDGNNVQVDSLRQDLWTKVQLTSR